MLQDLGALLTGISHEARRLARVKSSRGWSADELRRREASQWPLARKRKVADLIVDNETSLDIAGESLLKYLETRFPDLQRWQNDRREVTHQP